jgi:hypothetical protein
MPPVTPCKCTVSDLFHSPLGVLFTFPSRYSFTIGLMQYLALPVSSGWFIRAIRVSDYSRVGAQKGHVFRVRGHYPLRRCFPATSAICDFCNFCRTSTELLSYNPDIRRYWFGLFPFRSPLLRESQVLSSIHSNKSNRRKTTRYCFLFL